MSTSNPDNLARLRRNGAAVVRRLLAGRSTIAVEQRRYGVGRPAVIAVYHARTTANQRLDAWHRQRTSPGMLRLRADAAIVLAGLLGGGRRVKDVAAEYGLASCRVQDWYEESAPAKARRAAHRKKNAGANAKRLPVGTVVVRQVNGNPVRLVKVRLGGRPYGRWVPTRRIAWERLHGQVPAGHRIVPLGDPLDDSPANLACVTAAEALAMRTSDPAVRERQAAARLAGIARRTEDRRAIQAGRRGLEGPIVEVQMCAACGWESDAARCPKCGSGSRSVVRRPATPGRERPAGLALFLRELDRVA